MRNLLGERDAGQRAAAGGGRVPTAAAAARGFARLPSRTRGAHQRAMTALPAAPGRTLAATGVAAATGHQRFAGANPRVGRLARVVASGLAHQTERPGTVLRGAARRSRPAPAMSPATGNSPTQRLQHVPERWGAAATGARAAPTPAVATRRRAAGGRLHHPPRRLAPRRPGRLAPRPARRLLAGHWNDPRARGGPTARDRRHPARPDEAG